MLASLLIANSNVIMMKLLSCFVCLIACSISYASESKCTFLDHSGIGESAKSTFLLEVTGDNLKDLIHVNDNGEAFLKIEKIAISKAPPVGLALCHLHSDFVEKAIAPLTEKTLNHEYFPLHPNAGVTIFSRPLTPQFSTFVIGDQGVFLLCSDKEAEEHYDRAMGALRDAVGHSLGAGAAFAVEQLAIGVFEGYQAVEKWKEFGREYHQYCDERDSTCEERGGTFSNPGDSRD